MGIGLGIGIGGGGVNTTAPSSRGGSIASVTEETPLVGPPASTLTRRPALVPPKLIPDHDYEDGEFGSGARFSTG